METIFFSRKNTVNFILLISFGALFLFLGKFIHFDEAAIKSFLTKFPPLVSWVIFVLLYVVVTFFFWAGPKDLFRITAAVFFGPYLSSLLVYISEMINAVILFLLSRKLGRAFVENKMGDKLKKLDKIVAETSFLSVFFLRVLPIVPFRFLDMGFGLTKISFKKYFIICLIASPIRIFFIQFFLALGMDTVLSHAKLQQYFLKNPSVMMWSSLYIFSAIIIMFILKKKMKNRKETEEEGNN